MFCRVNSLLIESACQPYLFVSNFFVLPSAAISLSVESIFLLLAALFFCRLAFLSVSSFFFCGQPSSFFCQQPTPSVGSLLLYVSNILLLLTAFTLCLELFSSVCRLLLLFASLLFGPQFSPSVASLHLLSATFLFRFRLRLRLIYVDQVNVTQLIYKQK